MRELPGLITATDARSFDGFGNPCFFSKIVRTYIGNIFKSEYIKSCFGLFINIFSVTDPEDYDSLLFNIKDHPVVSDSESVSANLTVSQLSGIPVTIEDYRGKTASQVCRIVEQTVLEPLQKRNYEEN